MEEKAMVIDAIMDMLLTLTEALEYCGELYEQKDEVIFKQVLADFFNGVENIQKISGTVISTDLSIEFLSINSELNNLINQMMEAHEYSDFQNLKQVFTKWQKTLLINFQLIIGNN